MRPVVLDFLRRLQSSCWQGNARRDLQRNCVLRYSTPLLLILSLIPSLSLPAVGAESFVISPPSDQPIELRGDDARLQLQVTAAVAGRVHATGEDLTRHVNYSCSNAEVAQISEDGLLTAAGNGSATIVVRHQDQRETLTVRVQGVGNWTPGYQRDVAPILTKAGCAAAACHASQHGKGGFKLSVFGYDPAADYEEIARAARQRRVSLASPDMSLILRKPSMAISHGGGRRLERNSTEYRVLRRWIAAGTPPPAKNVPQVVALKVSPTRRVGRLQTQQQLRVVAEYDDGSHRDVTQLARFDSMDEGVVVAGTTGRVTLVGKGQAAVMVRYEGQAGISTFVIPYAEKVQLTDWKNNNVVDRLAENKFRELRLEPSPLCDDATFVRRAFLDATGSIPTIEETQRFLQSNEPDKRRKLVDQLLGLTGDPSVDIYNDRYAAFWTLKWSDLIRNNSTSVGEQGMWSLHNWIKESLRTNKPFDQFVRQLVTAKGSIYSNGPANYFRINRDSSALTESTAQLFLGVRLECAKCHHHPFEKYSQADYYGLAAFFSRVSTKNSEEFGIFGRETIVVVRSSGDVSHPKTRKRMVPTPLGGQPIDDELDRRIPLAQWLTADDNPFFARSVVNRYTGYLLGRGLVEPIDDMRSTNPPTNPELLDTLAKQFVENDYDLKKLLQTIMHSRLYQLSSRPIASNAADRRFYSHYQVKRIAAEPLLDAVDQATGVPTKFKSLPQGTRAIELPDAQYPNYFLNTFAKPRRASVCECERSPDANLAQALHTLNGDTLSKKISSPSGRIASLLAAKKNNAQIVKQLYLAALCRPPTKAELEFSNQSLAETKNPRQFYEDLLWALMNSKQFLFVY